MAKPYFVIRISNDQADPVVAHITPDAASAREWIEKSGEEGYRYVLAKWASGPFVIERVMRSLHQEKPNE